MQRLLATIGVVLVAGGAVRAAEEAPPFECDGRIAMIRRSEIVEGGSMDGFLEAVRDHIAWYRSHGVEDNLQVVARVVELDEETGAEIPSDREVVTLHVNPPIKTPLPVGDEAWNAFLEKYQANSRIVSATRVCLPEF